MLLNIVLIIFLHIFRDELIFICLQDVTLVIIVCLYGAFNICHWWRWLICWVTILLHIIHNGKTEYQCRQRFHTMTISTIFQPIFNNGNHMLSCFILLGQFPSLSRVIIERLLSWLCLALFSIFHNTGQNAAVCWRKVFNASSIPAEDSAFCPIGAGKAVIWQEDEITPDRAAPVGRASGKAQMSWSGHQHCLWWEEHRSSNRESAWRRYLPWALHYCGNDARKLHPCLQ